MSYPHNSPLIMHLKWKHKTYSIWWKQHPNHPSITSIFVLSFFHIFQRIHILCHYLFFSLITHWPLLYVSFTLCSSSPFVPSLSITSTVGLFSLKSWVIVMKSRNGLVCWKLGWGWRVRNKQKQVEKVCKSFGIM